MPLKLVKYFGINLISTLTSVKRKSKNIPTLVKWLGGTSFATFGIFVGQKAKPEPPDFDYFMTKPITEVKVLKDNSMKSQMELFIMKIQSDVCKALEKLEADEIKKVDPNGIRTKFKIDRWTRKEGGGGITCIIQNGLVFEKAGVNISVVHGDLPPAAAQQMRSRGKNISETDQLRFFAAGVSSVIHPVNPYVPTIHFNYRYFEIENKNDKSTQWWFGGGTDMTPYVLDEDDVKHFHGTLKQACDQHDRTYYGKFKLWCDNYFFIKHRNERRGVGGIFFDDFEDHNQEMSFNFVKSCGEAVLPSYMPIVKKNMNAKYSYNQRQWQLLRRGRYVEFNLIYDRGTKFGLVTPGARYESVLMSLPLLARWEYCHEPESESNEAKLVEILRNPKEWI